MSVVDELKRAAELVQHEHFMGRCASGMPLIGGRPCEFCGADWNEKCRRVAHLEGVRDA